MLVWWRLVQPEDVDAGVVGVAGPALVTVPDDVVALGDSSLELDVLAGILGGHPLEVLDERLLAVADVRVCWVGRYVGRGG